MKCPNCGGKLEALKCGIPSGHTHQCVNCGSLHSPHGEEEPEAPEPLFRRTGRRGDVDIAADIIRVARKDGGAKKTWIVYGAKLSTTSANAYLERMMFMDLLRLDGAFYHITAKGEEFLKRYEGLTSRVEG